MTVLALNPWDPADEAESECRKTPCRSRERARLAFRGRSRAYRQSPSALLRYRTPYVTALSRYLSDLIMGVPSRINHDICRHDRPLPIRLFGSEPTPLQSWHHGRKLY